MHTEHTRPTPGTEGSPEACAILRVLHRHRHGAGLSSVDLAVLAGVGMDAARAALHGLQARGRVHSTGHGMATRWALRTTSGAAA